MLLFEGKKISDLSDDKKTPEGMFKEDYHRWKKQIIDNATNNSIKMSYVQERVKEADPYDPNSRPESPQGHSIMATKMFIAKNYSGQVIYAERETRDKHGDPVFKPRRIEFKGVETFNIVRELDKIIFMTYISPFCKKEDWLYPQNLDHKYNVYELVNTKRKAEDYLANARLENKAKSIILGEVFDLSKNEEVFRKLASSYGITNAVSTSIEELQTNLDRLIFYKNRRKGMPEYNYRRMRNFIDDAEKQGISLDVGAIIQRGIDLGVIKPITRGRGQIWKYSDTGQNMDFKICTINNSSKRKMELKQYLMSNDVEFGKIRELIEKKEEQLSK